METKLKLCPFCGNEAGLKEATTTFKSDMCYYVNCHKEKCPGNNGWVSYSSKIDAITAWDSRVGERILKAEIVSLLKELPYLLDSKPELSDNFRRLCLLLAEM